MDGQYLKQIIADTIIFGFNSLKSSALKIYEPEQA